MGLIDPLASVISGIPAVIMVMIAMALTGTSLLPMTKMMIMTMTGMERQPATMTGHQAEQATDSDDRVATQGR